MYEVILQGTGDRDHDALREGLMRVFRADTAVVDRLLEALEKRPEISVKRGLSFMVAERYRRQFGALGLTAQVVPTIELMPMDHETRHVCPACGHTQAPVQDGPNICESCGVVGEKYADYERARRRREQTQARLELAERMRLDDEKRRQQAQEDEQHVTLLRTRGTGGGTARQPAGRIPRNAAALAGATVAVAALGYAISGPDDSVPLAPNDPPAVSRPDLGPPTSTGSTPLVPAIASRGDRVAGPVSGSPTSATGSEDGGGPRTPAGIPVGEVVIAVPAGADSPAAANQPRLDTPGYVELFELPVTRPPWPGAGTRAAAAGGDTTAPAGVTAPGPGGQDQAALALQRVELISVMAAELHVAGDLQAAAMAFAQAARVSEGIPNGPYRALSQSALARQLGGVGRNAEAAELNARALRNAMALQDPGLRFETALTAARTAQGAALELAAAGLTESVLDTLDMTTDPDRRADLYALLAVLATEQGAHEDADRWLSSALDAVSGDPQRRLLYRIAVQVELLRHVARHEDRPAVLREMPGILAAIQQLPSSHQRSAQHEVVAGILADSGNHDVALEVLNLGLPADPAERPS